MEERTLRMPAAHITQAGHNHAGCTTAACTFNITTRLTLILAAAKRDPQTIHSHNKGVIYRVWNNWRKTLFHVKLVLCHPPAPCIIKASAQCSLYPRHARTWEHEARGRWSCRAQPGQRAQRHTALLIRSGARSHHMPCQAGAVGQRARRGALVRSEERRGGGARGHLARAGGHNLVDRGERSGLVVQGMWVDSGALRAGVAVAGVAAAGACRTHPWIGARKRARQARAARSWRWRCVRRGAGRGAQWSWLGWQRSAAPPRRLPACARIGPVLECAYWGIGALLPRRMQVRECGSETELMGSELHSSFRTPHGGTLQKGSCKHTSSPQLLEKNVNVHKRASATLERRACIALL
eukprot:1134426-Pelagomonas_calceolata.AAC.2